MILLDTHAYLWLYVDDRRLGRRARAAVDRALRSEAVAVSAISFLELALLAERGRIRVRGDVEDLRTDGLTAGILELPVDGAIALLSAKLTFNDDPCDRIIVATALAHDARLVTADASILAMKSGPKRIAADR